MASMDSKQGLQSTTDNSGIQETKKVDIVPVSEQKRVAILDAGAQYGKVIDRRVRELSVLCDILPLSTPAAELTDYAALIISGGPQSVFGPAAPKYDPAIFKLDKPMLGVCYGLQLINHVMGGSVETRSVREDGQFVIQQLATSYTDIFHGLPQSFNVLLTHGDSIATVAAGFTVTARSEHGLVAAMENTERKLYGVQFHPEVDLTEHGMDMFRNFLFRVCKLVPSYTMECRMEKAIKEIREHVGDSDVLVLVSGGVDSSVCAALLHAALPAERIHCLHIDNGFMRYKESEKVSTALRNIGLKIHVLSAAETFAAQTLTEKGQTSQPLNRTLNPEVKRKIIGDTFMSVSEAHVRSLKLQLEKCFLCQGTLRPDLIESASNIVSTNADVIKTHHNDTQMVRSLRDLGRIVEPLKDLHKDEVRALGSKLGLPESLVWRQPFPGPGLAIRILCADTPFVTDDDDKIVASLKAIVTPETGMSATLLPCRTVGVQGDARTYKSVVALSCDGKPNWPQILDLAKLIPKKVHGVNRVVFAFGAKIADERMTSITPTRLSPDVILQLQLADEEVNSVLLKHKLTKKLSQVPVILFPVDFGLAGHRGICIRTFITNDFMTGVPALPGRDIPLEALDEMVTGAQSVKNVARVVYDLTPKPPGTTEWE